MEWINNALNYIGNNPDAFFAYISVTAAIGLPFLDACLDYKSGRGLESKISDTDIED